MQPSAEESKHPHHPFTHALSITGPLYSSSASAATTYGTPFKSRRTQSFRPPPLSGIKAMDLYTSATQQQALGGQLRSYESIRRKVTNNGGSSIFSQHEPMSPDTFRFDLYQVNEDGSAGGARSRPHTPQPILTPWQVKLEMQRDYENGALFVHLVRCQKVQLPKSGLHSQHLCHLTETSTKTYSSSSNVGYLSFNNSPTAIAGESTGSCSAIQHLSPSHALTWATNSPVQSHSSTTFPFTGFLSGSGTPKVGLYLRIQLSIPGTGPGKAEVRTSMVKRRLAKQDWDEVMTFPLSANIHREDAVLRAVLWAVEKPSLPHSALGERSASLEEWDQIISASKDIGGIFLHASNEPFSDLGQINVSLSYLPSAGRLTLDILEAKNLRPSESDKYPDVFVKAIFMDAGKRQLKTKRTAVVKETLNPVFSDSFRLDVNDAQVLERLSIIVSVYAYHATSRDECLGRVVLARVGCGNSGPTEAQQWEQMIRCTRTAVSAWHPLKTKITCNSTSSTSSADSTRWPPASP